jgi:hypothetical protein
MMTSIISVVLVPENELLARESWANFSYIGRALAEERNWRKKGSERDLKSEPIYREKKSRHGTAAPGIFSTYYHL